MPPQSLLDLSNVDLNRVIVDREGIAKINPHRHEFQQLDGIIHIDRGNDGIVGFRDVRHDEFWVRGHIPGRPIFPGVLMIETAAQLVSYFVTNEHPERGFLGFSGVDKVKFRGTVSPGQRIIVVGKMLESRARRCVGKTQGFVNGDMVYQGIITGMWL